MGPGNHKVRQRCGLLLIIAAAATLVAAISSRAKRPGVSFTSNEIRFTAPDQSHAGSQTSQPNKTPEQGVPVNHAARPADILARAERFRLRAARGLFDNEVTTGGPPADDEFESWRTRFTAAPYKHLWPYFFAGSVTIVGRMQSPEPVAAYYNPYVDGVILTQWDIRREGSHPRSATVLLREEFVSNVSGKSPSDLPGWAASDSISDSMAGAWGAFQASFREKHPQEASEVNSLESAKGEKQACLMIEKRALMFTAELARIGVGMDKEGMIGAVRGLLRDIHSPSGSVPPGALADGRSGAFSDVTGLSADLLGRMQPVLLIPGNTAGVAVLIDSGHPDHQLIAQFTQREGTAAPQLHLSSLNATILSDN